MNLYLIAGANSDAVKQALERNSITVVRSEASIAEALNFLSKNYLEYDSILLTDQGMINDYQNFSGILEGLKPILNRRSEFKFMTKDPALETVFKTVFGSDGRFHVFLTDQVKIPVMALIDFCISKTSSQEDNRSIKQPIDDTVMLKKPRSIFDKFKPGARQGLELESKPEEGSKLLRPKEKSNEKTLLSLKDSRKVVIITGHRGSGVTGTIANIASVASNQGLSVMILDMDTVYRGTNLFFTKFGDEVEINSDLGYSLIRCLMKPESYDINSCMINENLSLIALAYSVSSKDRILEAMDYKRVLSLISLLRMKYNLVLIDLPIEILKHFPDIITQIDSIGLCVNNNLYSVINTVKAVEESILKDTLLFRTKSRIIVSKYNENNRHHGKKFSPEFTCEILNDISGISKGEYQSGGMIPYSKDYDLQTSSGERICNTNSVYKNYYLDILKNLFQF
ncbi:P-loop NTPase family protein [Acetivibrio cellulolyticus]|uniref:cobyric acid synthase CobQ n=1 Tax=Acetivibrio cellulolyticus TaxID=35830 RepID=UPI0001E2C1C4|nr:cobyric acid synthase CobQ [Acetivibrio cellulolyticus]